MQTYQKTNQGAPRPFAREDLKAFPPNLGGARNFGRPPPGIVRSCGRVLVGRFDREPRRNRNRGEVKGSRRARPLRRPTTSGSGGSSSFAAILEVSKGQDVCPFGLSLRDTHRQAPAPTFPYLPCHCKTWPNIDYHRSLQTKGIKATGVAERVAPCIFADLHLRRGQGDGTQ